MTRVIGVRFRPAGKIYFFAPGKLEIKTGDKVIVETARGVEFGSVVTGPKDVDDEKITPPLKPVIRMATEADEETERKNKEKEKEEIMKKAEELDVVLVPYECERGMEATREIMKQIQPGQSIAIFIGPEGGFTPEEIEGICPTNKGEGFSCDLEERSYRISLGRRILRTETAGLATLSMLIFCLDE